MNKNNILLIFGFGYTAKFMCQNFSKKNWQVFCTTRIDEKKLNHLMSHQFFLMMRKKLRTSSIRSHIF